MPEPIKCFFLEPEDTPTGRYPSFGHKFKRSDTGELIELSDAPVGAMWFADWMLHGIDDKPDYRVFRGDDGHCLVVRCPGDHDWMVDGRCSNCTLPTDNIHKCWVRHGVPPDITVDKNGNTCSAGGGSIQLAGWHGFLRGGYLVE